MPACPRLVVQFPDVLKPFQVQPAPGQRRSGSLLPIAWLGGKFQSLPLEGGISSPGPGSGKFEQVEVQSAAPEYRGCPYLAVQVELKDREHPASPTALTTPTRLRTAFEHKAKVAPTDRQITAECPFPARLKPAEDCRARVPPGTVAALLWQPLLSRRERSW